MNEMNELNFNGRRTSALSADERVSDITLWKEELLAEIRADEVEMDNMKVKKINRSSIHARTGVRIRFELFCVSYNLSPASED